MCHGMQFNCQTLTGATLEDDGGEGSSMSHWETSIAYSEVMTSKAPMWVISNLTLAIMQDSGWYVPNKDLALPLRFGHKRGCEFIEGAHATIRKIAKSSRSVTL